MVSRACGNSDSTKFLFLHYSYILAYCLRRGATCPGFILGHVILAIFFPDRAQILTRCETVPQPKSVKEMSETCAYPLNGVNTHIFNEKETIF